MVIITSAIDVQKRRDVVVVDINGAFLTTYMGKDVLVVLQGRLLEQIFKTKISIY